MWFAPRFMDAITGVLPDGTPSSVTSAPDGLLETPTSWAVPCMMLAQPPHANMAKATANAVVDCMIVCMIYSPLIKREYLLGRGQVKWRGIQHLRCAPHALHDHANERGTRAGN